MAPASKPKTDEDWRALRFEANRIFTPSTPISVAQLFAGRSSQINSLLDTVAERGRHAIVYGEPGVGKTSLAQIIQHIVPTNAERIKYVRKSAVSSDNYSTIWMSIFKELHFLADLGEGEKRYPISDLYKDGVTPSDVVRELAFFGEDLIPIIVIDEYNLIKDKDSSRQMAETIKAVSDASVNVTIIIVGISDTVENLIDGHASIGRCSEEVLMPRMNSHEMQLLIESRMIGLGMKINGDAKWKIINLSKGLPAFAHSLGKGAVLSAIDTRKMSVTEYNVDHAIETILGGSQNTLKMDYEQAIRSNQERARFRQILTACALADTDESGYFTPKQVQAPLANILKKPIGIDGFNPNLKELASAKRGNVLQQIGSERIFRYRFASPAMQPFVIMKGMQDGFLDEKAKSALSAPEQGTLFSNEL
ncbi:AAA family ATPase [Methylobacterium sp. E-045]|uniref:AAA family ATPase n=1 Tax=Methylobacterium sp. E-045 TaxID=2836575 RepID=UPI001FBB5A7B|nr:AAA family ATPase [Methylobacterium sp. E-045]MCJ2131305.1 AAA family ATPase [Methylobacterium sp. E-045]